MMKISDFSNHCANIRQPNKSATCDLKRRPQQKIQKRLKLTTVPSLILGKPIYFEAYILASSTLTTRAVKYQEQPTNQNN